MLLCWSIAVRRRLGTRCCLVDDVAAAPLDPGKVSTYCATAAADWDGGGDPALADGTSTAPATSAPHRLRQTLATRRYASSRFAASLAARHQ